ncbi:hypothetical protein BH23ACT6_BH23ACT6_08810 [soil metagenome]
MKLRRSSGPSLVVIYWHDIPSVVLAHDGMRTHRGALPERFAAAIHAAAGGGGRAGSSASMQGWQRVERPCSPSLETEVDRAVRELAATLDEAALRDLVARTRAWLQAAQSLGSAATTASTEVTPHRTQDHSHA